MMESFVSSSGELMHSGEDHAPAAAHDDTKVGHRQQRWVTCSKSVVCFVLVASAALVGYFSWRTLSQEEEDDFVQQFQVNAEQVISKSTQRATDGVEQLQTLAGYTSAYASASGATFPNFTVPDWDAFSAHVRQTAGLQALAYSPLVMTAEERAGWEAYSVAEAKVPIIPYIVTMPDYLPDTTAGPWLPFWQVAMDEDRAAVTSTTQSDDYINKNLLQDETLKRLVDYVNSHPGSVPLSEIVPLATTETVTGQMGKGPSDDPTSLWVVPMPSSWPTASDKDATVGYLVGVLPWSSLLRDMLSTVSGHSLYVVVQEADTCRSSQRPMTFTYRIDGAEPTFLGMEDYHETTYNHLVERVNFLVEDGDSDNSGTNDHYSCFFTLNVYPSQQMEDLYSTKLPVLFTAALVGVFFLASFIFVVYDCLMQRQQQKTLSTAMRATSIVRSLFPHNVAEQLQAQKAKEQRAAARQQRQNLRFNHKKRSSKRDLGNQQSNNMDDSGVAASDASEELVEDKPMADLFPSATVFFADIAGFTAWSSSREPEQVFVLLENIYRAFDRIAVKRHIFKVETIGDCYVAACGLPTPNQDHAIAMCRFAVECREKFKELRCKLETKLGPDTGDLDLRIGMHSGPVTAGVLRGDRARFQLFGDTVNTASRMESNGERDRIHLSADTAQLLSDAGKGHWISARKDKIVAKGKGEMETFWLLTREGGVAPVRKRVNATNEDQTDTENNKDDLLISSAPVPDLVVKNEKFQRMIDWNAEILTQMLRAIIASRANAYKPRRTTKLAMLDNLEMDIGLDTTPFEEVGEPPSLPPDFDIMTKQNQPRPEDVDIDPAIEKQLHAYVSRIAALYRDNPFHSFEHASHASMSAVKLLSRVIGPLSKRRQGLGSGSDDDISNDFMMGENTYGITSDPLTQFTVVLSTVIHDCDHRGVPNSVLGKEEPSLASMYKHRSLAEQNALDVAWRTLMGSEFRELRRAIYSTPAELRRFRQILVNTVMATDLFDEAMANEREERWGTAFVPTSVRDSMASSASVRDSLASTVTVHYFRANVVLEYLVQASDVAHTMQHWAVYKKWNGKLYQESYAAWKAGRIETNPSDIWYQQELNFFDNYVIPLARRLKESGAFGVSGQEYLTYAEKNRNEWAVKGHDVVKALSLSAEGKLTRARRRSSGYGHG